MSRTKGQRSFWEQLQGQWRSRGISDTIFYNLIKFIVTKLSQYMIFVTCCHQCHHWMWFLCHMTLQLIPLSASTCINGFAWSSSVASRSMKRVPTRRFSIIPRRWAIIMWSSLFKPELKFCLSFELDSIRVERTPLSEPEACPRVCPCLTLIFEKLMNLPKIMKCGPIRIYYMWKCLEAIFHLKYLW